MNKLSNYLVLDYNRPKLQIPNVLKEKSPSPSTLNIPVELMTSLYTKVR
jgi:hypothetical protein